jgi:hypothetical protein
MREGDRERARGGGGRKRRIMQRTHIGHNHAAEES